MNFTLPRIDRSGLLISRDDNNYTKKSYELIDMIYDAMKCIKIVNHDEGRSIYVRYERGDFKDYAKLYQINIRAKKRYQEEYQSFSEDNTGKIVDNEYIVSNVGLLEHRFCGFVVIDNETYD